jgi:hypothetical protein
MHFTSICLIAYQPFLSFPFLACGAIAQVGLLLTKKFINDTIYIGMEKAKSLVL